MSLDDRVLDLAIRKGLVLSEDLPAPRPPASECLDRLVAAKRLSAAALDALRTEAERPRHASERLGPYELLEEIGRGGMGVVWRARDTRLGREVAVKVMISGEHASPEAIARFMREARAAGQLGVHPNIVPVLDVGEESARHYIVMDLVDGKPLDKLIDEGAIAPKRAAEIARQVALGVAHAHRKGILHRDLKPANVLVTRDGVPKLTDFGLARFVEDAGGLTRSGALVGTPHYMAPEQAEGQLDAIGVRTDVYGLGATLYEMLTERPPFDGGTSAQILRQVLLEEPRAPRRLNPAVPRDLETVCLKALEKDPGRRYDAAETLARDLERFAKGEPIAARPISRVERVVRWARRRPAAAVAILALAALAGVGVVAGAAAWESSTRRAARFEEGRSAMASRDYDGAIERFAAVLQTRPEDAEASRLLEEARAGQALRRSERDREQRAMARAAAAEAFSRAGTERLASYREAAERLRAARAEALAAQSEMMALCDPTSVLPGRTDRGAAFVSARTRQEDALARMSRVRDRELERQFGAALSSLEGALESGGDEARPLVGGLFAERVALERDLGRLAVAAALEEESRRILPPSPGAGAPAPARLRVETRPEGAEVLLAPCEPDAAGLRIPGPAKVLGRTPLGPVGIPAGSYLLRIRSEGYRDVLYPVTARLGEDCGTPEPIPLYTDAEIGTDFVYVPAGHSWLGEPDPLREEYVWSRHLVPGFFLARFEVTLEEWAHFVEETAKKDLAAARELLPFRGERAPGELLRLENRDGKPWVVVTRHAKLPVIGIRHPDACLYAAWAAGRAGRPIRLPREVEWERAARGSDGRAFPSGESFVPGGVVHADWPGHTDQGMRPRRVGSGWADESPFGVRDLAGSVSEWCLGYLDPSSDLFANRGGYWGAAEWVCRPSRRSGADSAVAQVDIGLRLACDLPPR
ncbi:MAG: protein kinase [Planctomycetales bacterium]|nr:protein kinase [Planctomycetales bacterium]